MAGHYCDVCCTSFSSREKFRKHKPECKPFVKKPIVEAVKSVKYDASMGLTLAWMYVEFGYKMCEKGHNIQMTELEFRKLMKESLP